MEFVGQNLKKCRLTKKIRLSKVLKDLNISSDLLNDIENDNITENINTVFLIGHIRSYAKYLDLDSNLIVEKYKIQISFNNDNSVSEISKPINSLNFFSFSKSFSFVSIIIISLSFYFLFVNSKDFQPDYVMTPSIPENFESDIEKTEMDILLKSKIVKNTTLETNDIFKEPLIIFDDINDLKSSSSVIASLGDPEAFKKFQQLITLKILNSTWIQLRDTNDNIIFSKLMNKGDEYSYGLDQNLNLTAGNAGNIVVLINGLVKGKVGRFGEVIDSLVIDNQFNN